MADQNKCTGFEPLPDDVMIEIFNLLPFSTRVKAQRVSKTWHQLMQVSRRCPRVTLVLVCTTKEEKEPDEDLRRIVMRIDSEQRAFWQKSSLQWENCSSIGSEALAVSPGEACQVLKSCRFLTRVRLHSRTNGSLVLCLHALMKMMMMEENIERKFEEFEVLHRGTFHTRQDLLALHCSFWEDGKLKVPDVLTCFVSETFDIPREHDFRNLSNLTKLTVHKLFTIDCTLLGIFPPNLSYLRLPNASFNDDKTIKLFLENFGQRLETLAIGEISEKHLGWLSESCTNLVSLEFTIGSEFFSAENNDSVDLSSKLKKLEHLKLGRSLDSYIGPRLKLSMFLRSPTINLKSLHLDGFFGADDTIDTLLLYYQQSLTSLQFFSSFDWNKIAVPFGCLSQLTRLETFQARIYTHADDCNSCLDLIHRSSSLRTLDLQFFISEKEQCSCLEQMFYALNHKAYQNKSATYVLRFRARCGCCLLNLSESWHQAPNLIISGNFY